MGDRRVVPRTPTSNSSAILRDARITAMNIAWRTLLAAFLIAVTTTSSTDAQYGSSVTPIPTSPPANPGPAARTKYPPSWYYDPYTDGSSAYPEGGEDAEPKCNVLIPPSYPAR
jgi:hypothetical protein